MIRKFLNASARPAMSGSVICLLSACVDPVHYETAPVTLMTVQGEVICQLYTHERVLWDRAIDRPETMTVVDADNICRSEGERLRALGAAG